ncbi:MAG: Rne/Rng family ribonuclease [Acidobacteria bacterium]|nr:Rne/Rng family ribonuclease [Acidobacteriota bacterium]
MTKEMIVSSNERETRVAILEDDEVVEIFIEREKQQGVVGNVYKGRVSKVLPGMQSAFVDIGLERDGFLYVTDVVDTAETLARMEGETDDEDEDGDDVAPSPAVPAVAADHEGLGDEAVTEAPDAAPAADVPAEASEGRQGHGGDRRRRGGRDRGDRGEAADKAGEANGAGETERERPTQKIEDLLKEGQEVLVQVVKEPLGTKGARLTCHVTIPGRFLVFMPTVDHVGVSRKIAQREERARLRGIVKTFREEQAFTGGVIIRTAASNRPDADIVGDLSYFAQVWGEVRRKHDVARAPAVMYREQSLVAKLLRDLLTDDYSAIRIDSPAEFQRTLRLVERIMPAMASRVFQHTRDYPIFEEYGVQQELDKALRTKVWLKSGGYLVINQTEALLAIDVNTGRYVGKKTGRLEDTIVKTNLEAAKEIVKQIRLRDLGGIIVLDFIDMEEKKNRQKVAAAVEQELRRDRAPSKVVQVAEFGLIIITRKRVKQSLERTMTEQCPYCSGTGTVKASATICYDILNELRKVMQEMQGQQVVLRVNPDIALALENEERDVRREIERTLRMKLTVKPDPLLHHEQFDVMVLQA